MKGHATMANLPARRSPSFWHFHVCLRQKYKHHKVSDTPALLRDPSVLNIRMKPTNILAKCLLIGRKRGRGGKKSSSKLFV